MSLDLTGIHNRNEYYTNHYLADAFSIRATEAISLWKQEAQANEQYKTPWSRLRLIAQQYGKLHNRYYGRVRLDERMRQNIRELADLYLQALGYGQSAPTKIVIDNDWQIPVYQEIKKENGGAYIWILLAPCEEIDDNILDGTVMDEEGNPVDSLHGLNNEDLISKIFFANQDPPRFLIFVGFNSILLADRNKWNEKRYLEFDIEEIFSRKEETTLQAMSVLLHRDSLYPQEGKILLDELDEDSQKNAAGVSSDLKYALRECIELLGNEVLYDLRVNKGRNLDLLPVDAGQLTLECLRYMYRMLFILFIESRPELGYAPMKADVYSKAYSLENLRSVAENVRQDLDNVGDGTYLNDSLNKLYQLIYDGYPANDEDLLRMDREESLSYTFVIHPLKAHIFDPERTAMLTAAKLRNSVLLKIIDLMSVTQRGHGRNGRRGRISYSNLGINQLGSVYEALLSYRGFLAQETLYEVKRRGDTFDPMDVGYFVKADELEQYDEDERVRDDKGQLRTYAKGTFIYRLAGREREKSASYYTPECLTKCLVKYALKELLAGKSADEILELKVCEPAMGSAAFLNEAINQLAEAYLDKKQQELGRMVDAKDRFTELQKVKMFIADRNIYGIDLNPVAVELAEVSLWLNTIYAGGYVPWFGTQLVTGNSLIGSRRQCYEKEQLTTNVQGLRWYDQAPVRVPVGKKRKSRQVYHFLLGDPGMCSYGDKVIKSLEPEKIKKMKVWNKAFIKPYTAGEVEMLLKLSAIIDDLWKMQVNARQTVENSTKDNLSFFGHVDRGDGCHETIRQRDKKYAEEYKSENKQNAGPYARLKFAMDYWCALWFWPIEKADQLPTRQQFLSDMQMILEGNMIGDTGNVHQYNLFSEDLGDTQAEDLLRMDTLFAEYKEVDLQVLCDTFPRLALSKRIAQQNRFMHWELEFADIFQQRGGFDLIIGNPPWIKLEWEEKGILSDKNPLFVIRRLSATEITSKRNQALADANTKIAYFEEYASLTGQQNFLNAVENYIELKGQQTNLYKNFLPQALHFVNAKGVFAFVHPDGVFNDPNGFELRKLLYPKLKYCFQFMNQLHLFADVDGHVTFYTNIYSNKVSKSFDMICNIYAVPVIDQSYTGDNKVLEGIKDANNAWSVKGHRQRILRIGEKELKLFAVLFDDSSQWQGTKLATVHAQPYLNVMGQFASAKKIKSLQGGYVTSEMWNETNSQNAGIIRRRVHFPTTPLHGIFSGPHIFVGCPLFQTARAEVRSSSDYDPVDLTNIQKDYLPRCVYDLRIEESDFVAYAGKTPWGTDYMGEYRLAVRKMLNLTQERTLLSAIIPSNISHIHGLLSVAFKDCKDLLVLSGVSYSLPSDFYLKVYGKTNLYGSTIENLPMLSNSQFAKEIIVRVLLLNCLTENYKDLWQEGKECTGITWAKDDNRLFNNIFAGLAEAWQWSSPLRSDYARRQALVEIDVLVAMALGITLEDLKNIYRAQFPVLLSYEKDTWYDANGRIVFSKKNMGDLTYKRAEFEQIKDAPAGEKFYRKIMDDTMPGGPVERTIEYVAPFDRCDREKDYETAWKFFEAKYGGQ